MSASSTLAAHAGLISLRYEPYAHFLCWERRRALRVLRGVGNRVLMSPSSGVGENTIGVASCFFEPRFSLSRYLTTMRRCSRIRRPRLSRCRYTFTPAPSSTARTNPGLQQLRGAQAAERHDYLGPARERGRAELSIPLPIVVVVRGVVAALEPGYSSFVIAGENSAVIEAGEAPRHGVHFTGPSREDHTTQVTYRAPGWAASSACRWVTW